MVAGNLLNEGVVDAAIYTRKEGELINLRVNDDDDMKCDGCYL